MEKKQKSQVPEGICPACNQAMVFYPGCCGNLPLWRCDECGHVAKWSERKNENEQYLKLK